MSPLAPLFTLHAPAAQRGDGLRPELLALLLRRAQHENHDQEGDDVSAQKRQRSSCPTSIRAQ
ncbi:hypothetical protein [Paraburkholderia heleia]|uniref:hypothetical protein n=1 Tax=Paraburkholderia heleia TaxID=634127 RepID=UPI0031D806CD